MDGGYLARIRSTKDTNSRTGSCDFCYQKNVKVRPLSCQNHFYCQVCEEFCPKIRKGDFSCKKCSQRTRMLDDQNRQKLDEFYVRQEGMMKPRKFEEVIISIDGSNIISFDDSDDDGDLDGNNTEWDFLIESLTSDKESSKIENETEKLKQQNEEDNKDKNDPDRSNPEKLSDKKKEKPVLNFVIPSTENLPKITSDGYGEHSFISAQPLRITGLGILPEAEIPSTTLEVAFPEKKNDSPDILCDEKDFRPVEPLDSVEGFFNFDSQSERGTSPVKAPKIINANSWLGLSEEDVHDEKGTGSIELFAIEGPRYRTGASPESDVEGSNFDRDLLQRDDFWDF